MAFSGTTWAGVLALCLTAAITSDAGAGFAQEKDRSQKTEEGILLPTSKIIKFGEVTPHLFRGGQPNAEGLAALKKMGVGIVVDMRSGNREQEKEAVTKLGMKYVQISWHCPFPSDTPFAKFLKIIEDNQDKKVFVHCRLGDDRTGMAVAAYRMAEQDWSADEAMKEMEDFGFRGVHHAICPGLAGYEKSFPEKLKKDSAFANLKIRSSGAKESSK